MQMQKMMKKMKGGGMAKMMRSMQGRMPPGFGPGGGLPPGGMPPGGMPPGGFPM
jgi:signal recognition particle subunit SRP54